jgi:hypothetical protein
VQANAKQINPYVANGDHHKAGGRQQSWPTALPTSD